MAIKQRPTLPDLPTGGSIEEYYQEYCWHAMRLSGGRFSSNPHAYAQRQFIRPGLWRITEPEEILDAHRRGIFTLSTIKARIDQMSRSEPFPSSPTRPPVYSIRFDSPRGLAIHSFCLAHVARTFIEHVIRTDDYNWKSDHHIHVPTLELTVSSHKLEEVMESTARFDLPAPYPQLANNIRNTPTHYEPAVKTTRPAQSPKTNTNATTLAQICSTLSIEPRNARQLLRKLKIDKPAAGWQWDDPTAILEKLRAAL